MKTKVMDTKALQALLQVNGGTEPVVDEAAEAAAKAALEAEANEAVDETPDTEKLLADSAELNTKLQAEVDGLKISLQEGADALETAAAAHATDLATSTAPLIEIITGQLKTMRIGLSLSDIDMSAWDTETVVREYAATSKSFLSSFPAGPVVPDAADEPVEKEKFTSADQSALDSLDF